jgi:hypothetical protein
MQNDKIKEDTPMRIQITPKGVLMTAVMLYERGFLRRKVVDRVRWFHDSGIGWENAEFRKLWRKIQFSVRQARAANAFADLEEAA